jgi:magnesium transporter
VIQIVLRAGPNGVEAGSTAIADLSEIITQDEAIVWADVVNPSQAELNRIGEEFGFHPLTLEDILQGERPKIDLYEGYQFIVFYGLATEDERCSSHEVDIFVGKHYMVTIHDGELPVLSETAKRWRAHASEMESRNVGFLLYSLLDALVDEYFTSLDSIAERAENLEETVILGGQPALQSEILQLRRELLMIRRVAGPERDVLNVLIRQDPPLYGQKEVIYFQDVYDHLLRVLDSVDIYRDILSSVLDANLSMVSYNLNQLVKRLTSWTIILMSMSLVAGNYGMNFDFMPELHWSFGYPWALALMVVIAFFEFRLFKRIDWL